MIVTKKGGTRLSVLLDEVKLGKVGVALKLKAQRISK
jgi:hypothetical protein